MNLKQHLTDMLLWHPVHHRRETQSPFLDEKSDQMKALVEDITKHGVLIPLIVTSKSEDGSDSPGYYFVVDGRNRHKAALLAGIEHIPVIIRDDLSPRDILKSSNIRSRAA